MPVHLAMVRNGAHRRLWCISAPQILPERDSRPDGIKYHSEIRVGIIHSLTGTMAISEDPVIFRDIAIEEINSNGASH